MWHLSHEGADLESPWNEPKNDLYMIVTPPEQAPDAPEYIELTFEQGIPVTLNGELDAVAMIEQLNEIGAEHGIGGRIWWKTVWWV